MPSFPHLDAMTATAAVVFGARGGIVIDPDGTASVSDLNVGPDGRIVAHTVTPAGYRTPGMDATGTVVLPGFVDAHEHLRSLSPGSRDDEGAALPELLANSAKASETAQPDDYRALTALGAARLARAGVTSAIDHIYPLHQPGMLQAAIDGHQQIGIRVSIAVGIMTKVPAAIRATPASIFDLIDQVADIEVPAEQLFVAPVSLRQTDVDAYRATVDFAVRRNLRLYTHISESVDEVESCVAEHGVRPVQLLDRIGFLRPGTVLVHCVHLDEKDIETIASRGASVVYCPTNHLWLAKGTAPVLAMRSAGINVCLGLDGMGEPFSQMRQAIFAQGSAAGNPGAMTTDAAFTLATSAGATAFDAAGVTGALEPGAPADFITVRSDTLPLQPMVDPLYSVVRHTTDIRVRDVVVGGVPVVRDGRLTRADENELIDRAWHSIDGIARRGGRPPLRDWRQPPPATNS